MHTCDKDDEVGRTLQVSIDHLQLQAGTSWPVLSRPGKKQRHYVDPCYASHTWEFLDSINSHIRLEPDLWIRPQRERDCFIMEDAANLPGIKPIELVHTQRVRLYLNVTTLADITTSDGKEICDWATKVHENPRKSTHRFPRQDKPLSPQVLATWRNVIHRCYASQQAPKLDNPLGPWHKGRISQAWNTVYEPETGHIHIWRNGRVELFEPQRRSRFRYRFLCPNPDRVFPIKGVPISGEFQSGYFVIKSTYSRTIPPPDTVPEQVLEMQKLNRGVTSTIPLAEVAKAFWEGKAIMGTDGSVKGEVATYSWVISIKQDDIQCNVKGGGFLPATAQYLDPYSKRPEAAALFAGTTWIHELLTRFPRTDYPHIPATSSPVIPIPVDNDAVVKDVNRTITDQTPTFHLLSPDYDILQAIRTTLEDLPLPTEIFHVKSHQDKNKKWDELNNFAQINVLADRQANEIYSIRPRLTGLFPTWVPGTRAALFHGNSQVTKSIPEYIREAKHTPDMKRYLIRRSKEGTGRTQPWDEHIYESIDWKHLGENFKKNSNGKRIQLSKYMNDLLATNKRLQTIDNRHDGRCFACHQLHEDTNHVL